jgi:hypothetical protein
MKIGAFLLRYLCQSSKLCQSLIQRQNDSGRFSVPILKLPFQRKQNDLIQFPNDCQAVPIAIGMSNPDYFDATCLRQSDNLERIRSILLM